MLHLNRRDFLRSTGVVAGALAMSGSLLQAQDKEKKGFTLPPLPYPYDALEPVLDARTMEFHHDKHHQTYVDNLNKAVAGHPELLSMSIQELMANLKKVPKNILQAVINNGGGHLNHSMFWQMMAPPGKGGEPDGDLAKALESAFGSVDKFRERMTQAAVTQFGSGYGWLVWGKESLRVLSTPNQATPISMGLVPLLTVDVWEHAYYLKYQNRRAEFVKNWWKIVNWNDVNERFKKARQAT